MQFRSFLAFVGFPRHLTNFCATQLRPSQPSHDSRIACMSAKAIKLFGIKLADPPSAWESAGFHVQPNNVIAFENSCAVTLTTHQTSTFTPQITINAHINASCFRYQDEDDSLPEYTQQHQHPNSVTRIDHVVVTTNSHIDDALAILAEANLQHRKLLHRNGYVLALFKLSNAILELVASETSPTTQVGLPELRLWGVTFACDRIGRVREVVSPDYISPTRRAVQRNHEIATLRHKKFRLGIQVAVLARQANDDDDDDRSRQSRL